VSQIRKAAFDALAKTKLDPVIRADFEAIHRRINKRAKERNKIVHGYWAISNDHPDGLLLLNLDDIHRKDFIYKNTEFETWAEERSSREALWKRVKIDKYISEDFRAILSRLKELEREAELFMDKMWLVSRGGQMVPPQTREP
jgi:hypothetical protein